MADRGVDGTDAAGPATDAVSDSAPLPPPSPPVAESAAAAAAAAEAGPASAASTLSEAKRKPVACIVIGMAGSGKTTLMQRLNAHVHEHKIPTYLINLDPAAIRVPFGAHIDIRDTVNYKDVMSEYKLGPNGAIMTSLNLFATRFDQVLGFVEKRADELKYILADTPGQIEVFTWSASGAIITDSLAFAFPTVLVFVVDTPRCTNTTTFMSNMLYACSIMYKTRLPLVLVFNKTDVEPHEFALEWMTDYEMFQAAVDNDTSYMGSFVHSASLALDEFYKTLKAVGVSAVTGAGMDDFFAAVDAAAQLYEQEYRPELEKRIQRKTAAEAKRQDAQMAAFRRDHVGSALQPHPSELDAGARDVGIVRRGVFEDSDDEDFDGSDGFGEDDAYDDEDDDEDDGDDDRGPGFARPDGREDPDDDDDELIPPVEREYARLQAQLPRQ